jgi:hypothetical protein
VLQCGPCWRIAYLVWRAVRPAWRAAHPAYLAAHLISPGGRLTPAAVSLPWVTARPVWLDARRADLTWPHPALTWPGPALTWPGPRLTWPDAGLTGPGPRRLNGRGWWSGDRQSGMDGRLRSGARCAVRSALRSGHRRRGVLLSRHPPGCALFRPVPGAQGLPHAPVWRCACGRRPGSPGSGPGVPARPRPQRPPSVCVLPSSVTRLSLATPAAAMLSATVLSATVLSAAPPVAAPSVAMPSVAMPSVAMLRAAARSLAPGSPALTGSGP